MAVDGSTPIAPGGAATLVTGAIRNAAQTTGTSFSYLLATAKIESNLDPGMTTQSSSASGLFQFIDQTWLGMLKQAGPAFGYGDYANAIQRDSAGRWVVPDRQMHKEIMQLRTDPNANAVMAGAFTQQNTAALTRRIGRAPSDGELYVAHFFGAGGAGKLISLMGSNPQAKAADIFPQAARANHSIFYDRQGNARSVAGVYGELVRRYEVASGGAAPGASMVARASQGATGTVAVAQALAAAGGQPSAGPSGPILPAGASFDSLFSDSGRRTALAPVVAALWSDPAAGLPAGGSAPFQPASRPAGNAPQTNAGAPLDLFQETHPNARALFGG
jgi:hypothetical protein